MQTNESSHLAVELEVHIIGANCPTICRKVPYLLGPVQEESEVSDTVREMMVPYR